MKGFPLVLAGLVLGGVSFLILMYLSIEMVGTTTVPNIVGLTPEKAKEVLKHSHLSCEIIGSGKVLRTHPKAGERVKENRVVKLYCEEQKKDASAKFDRCPIEHGRENSEGIRVQYPEGFFSFQRIRWKGHGNVSRTWKFILRYRNVVGGQGRAENFREIKRFQRDES